MSEWWAVWSSYRPSDFLMFSPRTYWRLIELANREAWPLQLLVLAAGAMVAWGLWRDRRWAWRALCLLLGAAWAAVAWYWHLQRYAAINWAANAFAAGFALQAVLWLVAAARPVAARVPLLRRRVGLALWLFALLVYPLIGLALGRPPAQAESLAVSPDPTLLASLGALLVVPRRAWLWPLPLLACAISGLTLWTMDETVPALLLAMAALLAVALAARSQR